MKTRVFEVPKKLIREFASMMDKHELNNRIQGVNDEGEIEIAIEYESDQKKAIGEIDQMLNEYYDETEE